MTEAMPFLQKYDITFLRPPTILRAAFFERGSWKQLLDLSDCGEKRDRMVSFPLVNGTTWYHHSR
jgi:hypothetical protein